MPVKRVLLVEDNADNRFIYSAMLRHAGYDVVLATNGHEGLELGRTNAPDLVLMDISLPGLDGLEVTRRLKAESATRHIPIVALTAHALPADRVRALEAGCDAYLAKPIAPPAVLAEVRRLIGPPVESAERAQ
jgi:two-component system, cell cycle response regulator DivK